MDEEDLLGSGGGYRFQTASKLSRCWNRVPEQLDPLPVAWGSWPLAASQVLPQAALGRLWGCTRGSWDGDSSWGWGYLQQLVWEFVFRDSSNACPVASFWRGSLRGKCVFRLLWSSQRILVLNRGIYLGSDLDCDEDGDTFFGAMRPGTQRSLRSPSRGRKEQRLFSLLAVTC